MHFCLNIFYDIDNDDKGRIRWGKGHLLKVVLGND